MNHLNFLMGVGGILLTSLSVAAPVVESRSAEAAHSPYHHRSSPHSSGYSDNRSHQQTLSLPQIEVLEQEVRQLRGQLEEQAYELKRLTKSQQELYLDLERRLQAKGGSGATNTSGTRSKAPTPSAPPVSPSVPNLKPIASMPQKIAQKAAAVQAASKPPAAERALERPIYEPTEIVGEEEFSEKKPEEKKLDKQLENTLESSIDAGEEEMEQISLSESPKQNAAEDGLATDAKKPAIVVKGVLAEKNMYENAYNLVLNKRYAEAVPALQAFLAQYPQGQYAPNGHYWLGEVYSLQGKANKNAELLNKASVEFMAITTQFPNHQKAMDALLKLGILESDKGNIEAARQYLTHVKERYPGTSVARIASTHLQRLK